MRKLLSGTNFGLVGGGSLRYLQVSSLQVSLGKCEVLESFPLRHTFTSLIHIAKSVISDSVLLYLLYDSLSDIYPSFRLWRSSIIIEPCHNVNLPRRPALKLVLCATLIYTSFLAQRLRSKLFHDQGIKDLASVLPSPAARFQS